MSSQLSEQRQVVRFAFYRLDGAWRRLSAERQASSKIEFAETIERFHGHLLLRPYGLGVSAGIATSCCGRWPKISIRWWRCRRRSTAPIWART